MKKITTYKTSVTMKKVTAYKTSDGTLYEDEDLAKRQETIFLFKEWYYANNHLYENQGNIDVDDLLEWLSHKKHKIKELLEVL